MEQDELEGFIKRIAIALERIAISIEKICAQGYPENELAQEKTVINRADSKINEIAIAENIEKDAIEIFLSSKNIKIKVIPPEDAADDVINSLADFLGRHYNALSELLSKIKSNMQRGGFITLTIKDYTQKNVSDTCQFCTRLHEIAFLEQNKYFKSPQFLIKSKTTKLPTAQNFFSGKWLERFVL